jgi:hypothetical protein
VAGATRKLGVTPQDVARGAGNIIDKKPDWEGAGGGTYLRIFWAAGPGALESRNVNFPRKIQSSLCKQDVKFTAKQSRLEQDPCLTVVICMEIGLKGQESVPLKRNSRLNRSRKREKIEF